jgi:hypothetical protein
MHCTFRIGMAVAFRTTTRSVLCGCFAVAVLACSERQASLEPRSDAVAAAKGATLDDALGRADPTLTNDAVSDRSELDFPKRTSMQQ